jgi:thioredoxin reductase
MANQLGTLASCLQADVMDFVWDCVIVGGGAAGLSAGLVLGRARRRTLLIDVGEQSNLPAHGIGGLLGHDGRPPAELYAMGRRELAAYPSVEVRTGDVVAGERAGDVFELKLADGHRERTRRVLLATGMEYRPPSLPGLAELWGRSVFHCPFCDGWEVRDQPLAVLARGERAVHSALLLRGWSDDVVLLTDGPADLDADDRGRLAAAGISIDERPVAELVGRDGELEAVAFTDGSRLERRGLLAATMLHQRSRLAEQLGAQPGKATSFGETPVEVDSLCRTTAPGVFAAGDLSTQLPPQVASAIAAGSLAATGVVQSLLAEDYGLPVPEWRQHVDA